jgi:hypothetical protein
MSDDTVQKESEELSGAYEILRRRLRGHGDVLKERVEKLNAARRDVFGSVEMKLTGTERVLTANNCVPRDIVAVGPRFLFGYNVQLGLRKDMRPEDVFALYTFDANGFNEAPPDFLENPEFVRDFTELYKYYKNTTFAKFFRDGPHVFMVFRVGRDVKDVKCFKWLRGDDGSMTYQGNRSDHEYKYPSQHEFQWTRATRDMQRPGACPHISFQDRVFVETVGGTLTIKIEDNTATGEGIYSEPVDDPDQTLDDAEYFFSAVGNLILMKIRPYREEKFRYFVYSEKVHEARRLDAIAGACVLLPEDHGIIFSNGYYLQTGEFKQFEGSQAGMLFERRVVSPNGEDTLYIFYNRETGCYNLLSYNLIAQKADTPIDCNGYSLFKDGELVYFRAQEEPTKSHVLQIWQTPYSRDAEAVSDQTDSLLFKIGNRDIVRCMAGCQTLIGLVNREDNYANLYLDVSRQATDLLDSFFWIRDEKAFNLGEPLDEIKTAAAAAIDEYEKVEQLRQVASSRLAEAETETRDLLNEIRLRRHDHILEHVETLAGLRALRGKVVSLRELRYMNMEAVEGLDTQVKEAADRQARRCVDFLLADEALAPYAAKIAEFEPLIGKLKKVKDGQALREDIEKISGELEMLVDIVSNLNIEDATQRTRIIDGISSMFSTLNQARAALQNKVKALAAVEGEAEFGSQMKLISQAVINYLDVSDSPAKCEDYLGRVMIQLEELEGKFSDFDDYVLKLSEKREEVYNAFETRRLALVEARNKRADTLQRSAERILSSIRSRIAAFKTVEEINGYFASDLMIEKLRGIVDDLIAMDDPVKAGDIETKLKSAREDGVRQLHDKSELFVGGANVLKFGRHQFTVNTQALDLTIVPRGDQMMIHLTGTNFFEAITDAEFLATREVWSQSLISENASVYRAEYLAYLLLREPGIAEVKEEDLAERVTAFMAPRYAEGYQKGVHDEDALKILTALLELHGKLGLLKAHTLARALAVCFWHDFRSDEAFELTRARLAGMGAANKVFRQERRQEDALADLRERIEAFAAGTPWFDAGLAGTAAVYLYDVVSGDGGHPVSPEAVALLKGFRAHLKKLAGEKAFAEAREKVASRATAEYGLVREWIAGYLAAKGGDADLAAALDEAAALELAGVFEPGRVSDLSVRRTIEGLRGSHDRIVEGQMELHYNEFVLRLERFTETLVPRFEAFTRMKKAFLDRERKAMRLDEFKPKVMTSFVRNRLIDSVYLSLIGDNLAKQIGVAGKNTRTDRMGMLLLISPPGYGKTTLMEYVANRLGVVFMKINGPAIGHHVTSLDPSEAPNAAAREELNKLGLALEMGDNVMLYLDDIQHCNPEFLQKFISLCDAQRKIEGVYKGNTKTYDLRGKKVSVVMAGNPYTESGEKFKIPDMLSNRADTYNLGDILGDNLDAFKLSFLENALTSNPALNRLAAGSKKDIYGVIRMAETGSREGVELEGKYAGEELNEMVAVMERLVKVRDVVLRVNEEYIRSAGQADEFRTEPAFKLQGSYRNMNRLAEKVEAVMNDRELEVMIYSEYENEAQTLTTGAEANLLKFKHILGKETPEEAERWKEIRRTYARNQLMRGAGEDDRVGQAVVQLSALGDHLTGIKEVLAGAAANRPGGGPVQAELGAATLDRMEAILGALNAKPEVVEQGAPVEVIRLLEGQFKELIQLVGEVAGTQAERRELLRTCRRWRDEFFVPLRDQSDGKPMAKSIYLTDLEKMIHELDRVTAEGGL